MVVSSKRDRWIAPLPRFVIHRSDLSHELRKSYLSRFEQLLTVRLAIVHIRAPQPPGLKYRPKIKMSQFINKFRKLGLVDYNGEIIGHNSLLSVALNDNPHLKARPEPSGRSSGRTASTA
jgi:hypothetical protein